MIIQPQINLDVLSLSLLLQIFLLANNGFIQQANGVTVDPTASEVITTSPIVDNSSLLNETNGSSVDVTPSSLISENLVTISPSPTPDIPSSSTLDISPTSATLNIPNNVTDNSSFPISISPSETAMVTESSIMASIKLSEMVTITASTNLSENVTGSIVLNDSSFYPMLSDSASFLLSTALNTEPTNQTSIVPDLISKTSEIWDPSSSNELLSSSIDISPTQTTPADFVTTKINETTDSAHDLSETTTITAPKNQTLKSSESTSSKIAAGICIPLAIITVLGITFYFYRKRHQDRSVKFTDTGSTWSYANASFTDDAVKTGVKQNQ